jgi:hypothetical protein
MDTLWGSGMRIWRPRLIGRSKVIISSMEIYKPNYE